MMRWLYRLGPVVVGYFVVEGLHRRGYDLLTSIVTGMLATGVMSLLLFAYRFLDALEKGERDPARAGLDAMGESVLSPGKRERGGE